MTNYQVALDRLSDFLKELDSGCHVHTGSYVYNLTIGQLLAAPSNAYYGVAANEVKWVVVDTGQGFTIADWMAHFSEFGYPVVAYRPQSNVTVPAKAIASHIRKVEL